MIPVASQVLSFLPVADGEHLATLATAAREHLLTLRGLGALQKTVFAEPATPFELTKHDRERLQKGKGAVNATSLHLTGLPAYFFR